MDDRRRPDDEPRGLMDSETRMRLAVAAEQATEGITDAFARLVRVFAIPPGHDFEITLKRRGGANFATLEWSRSPSLDNLGTPGPEQQND